MKALERFLQFIKDLFWVQPTTRPLEPKATDVIDKWICVKYKGQWINLRKNEVEAWENLSRKGKREIAMRTAKQVRQGKIRFVEIDGKMTCVKNKDYGQNRYQHSKSKAGSRKQ